MCNEQKNYFAPAWLSTDGDLDLVLDHRCLARKAHVAWTKFDELSLSGKTHILQERGRPLPVTRAARIAAYRRHGVEAARVQLYVVGE